jgi:hypothetical protein
MGQILDRLHLAVSGPLSLNVPDRPEAEIATTRKQSFAVLEADVLRLGECGLLTGKLGGHKAVI